MSRNYDINIKFLFLVNSHILKNVVFFYLISAVLLITAPCLWILEASNLATSFAEDTRKVTVRPSYSALHKSLQSPPFFACLYLYATCLLRLRICQMCHHQPSRLSGMNRFVSYLRWLGLSKRCSKTTFIGLLGLSGIFSGISEVRPGTYLVQKADRAVTPLSSTSLMVGETAPNQVGNIQAQTSVKLVQIVNIYAKHCK